MSWKKTQGGMVFAWIGFEVSLREMSLGISAGRSEWAMTWMTRMLDNGGILIRELREALGRLVLVYGALTWDKPFLGPLYAFMSRHSPGTCVELILREDGPCLAERPVPGT